MCEAESALSDLHRPFQTFNGQQHIGGATKFDHFWTPYSGPARAVLRSYPALMRKASASLAVAASLLGSVSIQSCFCALTEVGVE
jgi:hypothetical protein